MQRTAWGIVTTLTAALGIAGCGNDQPPPQQGVAPAVEDESPPQTGRITSENLAINWGELNTKFNKITGGRSSSIGATNGEVICTAKKVVVQRRGDDPKITVTRDGQVTVESDGQVMQPVPNNGTWTPQVVQISAIGPSLWTDDEGKSHSAVSVEGAVACGVPPASPTTTTGP